MAEEKRDHNSNCTRRPISHVSVCQTVICLISCVSSSAQLSKRFFRCVLSCNLRGNVITNFNTR